MEIIPIRLTRSIAIGLILSIVTPCYFKENEQHYQEKNKPDTIIILPAASGYYGGNAIF